LRENLVKHPIPSHDGNIMMVMGKLNEYGKKLDGRDNPQPSPLSLLLCLIINMIMNKGKVQRLEGYGHDSCLRYSPLPPVMVLFCSLVMIIIIILGE
jgi:hypothetical protein